MKKVTLLTTFALAAFAAAPAIAQSSIEGNWSFPIYSQFNEQETAHNATIDCEATVNGDIVTFTPQYDSGAGDSFVAELSGTTLTFSKVRLGADNIMYPLWQVPCVNTNDVNELTALAEDEVDTITATYDEAAGTITFDQEKACLLFGHLTQEGVFVPGSSFESKSWWKDAFQFNGPATRSGDLEPILSISVPEVSVSGANVTVTVDVTAERFELSDAASWKAVVNNWDAAAEGFTLFQVVDATVSNGVATFTLTNLAAGEYSMQFTLQALDAQGAVIVTSNLRAMTPVIGAALQVRNAQATVDGSSVTVTIDITLLQGFDSTTVYKVKLTESATITEEYEGDSFEVDATVANNQATFTLENLADGKYDYLANLEAYSAAGALLASSNNAYLVFEVGGDTGGDGEGDGDIDSGVETIGSDNAPVVIYNLQGVRVNGDNLRPGLYIINGKKTAVR